MTRGTDGPGVQGIVDTSYCPYCCEACFLCEVIVHNAVLTVGLSMLALRRHNPVLTVG